MGRRMHSYLRRDEVRTAGQRGGRCVDSQLYGTRYAQLRGQEVTRAARVDVWRAGVRVPAQSAKGIT